MALRCELAAEGQVRGADAPVYCGRQSARSCRLKGVAAHSPQAGRCYHDVVRTPVRPWDFAVGANGEPTDGHACRLPPSAMYRVRGARATMGHPAFNHPLDRVLSSGAFLLAHRLPTCMRGTVYFEQRVQPPPTCAAYAPCRRRICKD